MYTEQSFLNDFKQLHFHQRIGSNAIEKEYGENVSSVIALRLKALFLVQKIVVENGVAAKYLQDLICNDEYVNHQNSKLLSALLYAFDGDHPGACLLLLNEGADVDTVKYTSGTFSSTNGGCGEILKRFGWGGWTPLLISAEKGAKHVKWYLKEREKLRQFFSWKTELHKRTDISASWSSWLKKKIIFYMNVKEIRWTWVSSSDDNGISITDGKLTVTRNQKTSADYSCAIGNESFIEGTYSWDIRVGNVKSIWLGIVKADKREIQELNSLPGSRGEYVLVFGNGGIPVLQQKRHKQKTVCTIKSNTKFLSGQIVGFKLDMKLKTLEMKIDGQCAVTAANVDCEGCLPYVCMGYNESATLISRYHVPNCDQNDEKYHISWDPSLEEVVMKVRKWGE